MTNPIGGNKIRPIRVGIVGAGNWANHGHLRVLDLLPDYEVVAIYARRGEAAAKAATQFHIAHVAASVDGLVARPEVDLVCVLNTAPQHAETVAPLLRRARMCIANGP
jgi:predicted dehydrogenase